MCGGKVLRCLTDKIDEIKAEACKKEVFYFEKMEVRRFLVWNTSVEHGEAGSMSTSVCSTPLQVSNFKNDVLLAEACRTDVDKFCGTVEPGKAHGGREREGG